MANTTQYCNRMSKNITMTTKNLIPGYIGANINKEFKTILDVGCADGSFTKYVRDNIPGKVLICGIDANADMVRRAKKRDLVGISFHNAKLDQDFIDTGCFPGYDCVLFSSVMHEISSYSDVDKERFSTKPIREAIAFAAKALQKDGIIVIRDMIKPPKFGNKQVVVEFRRDVARWFLDFIQDCPYLTEQYDKNGLTKFFAYDSGQRLVFQVREDVLMEFLMCYTWGLGSVEREIREKKFIMSRKDWTSTLTKNGFSIETFITTNEEYPKYFDKLVTIWTPDWTYPETTCLIVAKKKG